MKVKELLSDSSKWIQGANARDRNGRKIAPESPYAICWCLFGAIVRCYAYCPDQCIKVANHILVEYQMLLPKWNDAPERTFADIKELVERLDI